ncbi:MAG: ATP phosphoribosyltransferase regulatory subunit, partial [Pseudomonadota bacterium]
MTKRNWRLPAGVDELLPPDAWALEITRRRVLDVFHGWGYEYIDPPIVEYLDALLVGAGTDMDLQTLKTVDQQSGRLLGVRSDMTAQAVRVDAHSRPETGVQRLCYAGNVVFANPASSLDRRVPLKAGAELFGAPSLAADAEVVALMLEVLASAGLVEPILVLGHMGIFRSLTKDLELSEHQSAELFEAMQNKAEADIARVLAGHPRASVLTALPGLMGEQSVLAEARACFAGAALPAAISTSVLEALDRLEELADLVSGRAPGVALRFDIAELTGYGYHNGPVFSAYHADRGSAVARGGRYDG